MTNGLKEENMNKKSLNSSTLILVLFAFMNSSFGIAQNSECKKKLDAFLEFSKEKNFDKTTYEPWLELKNQCPAYDESIYIIGEKILSKKVFQADASEAKNAMVIELASLYDEHDKNFKRLKETASCFFGHGNYRLASASKIGCRRTDARSGNDPGRDAGNGEHADRPDQKAQDHRTKRQDPI